MLFYGPLQAREAIQRQNVLNLSVTQPMNIQSEFAGMNAWANARR